MPFHLFGIRHHGPGSARSLVAALEALAPDCVLLEGPAEAEGILAVAARPELKPPVALLIYDAEKPQRAVYYPFAVFSPEWQTLQYALRHQVPVRLMDLPQSIQMAQAEARDLAVAQASAEAESSGGEPEAKEAPEEAAERPPEPGDEGNDSPTLESAFSGDPLEHLSRAAGYSDAERWWEHQVEHRQEGKEVFAGIHEAMTALREAALQSGLERRDPEREALREASMRQTMRAAEKEGFQRIAVVCGAWHTPALATLGPAKEDAARLKGLPKRKVNTTWIPWTYGRLTAASGYGAGVISPGWYDFLWEFHGSAGRQPGQETRLSVHWLTRVAQLLRGEDLEASSASVIETVRLAEALAALRHRPLPGLEEFNEAVQTVLCLGDPLPLRLISQRQIVSERLGEVPDDVPQVPLAQDLAREQKRLRLPPEASARSLDLDLRKPNDLERSRLLHRLSLLNIAWGERGTGSSSQKGTFHELWTLQWQPEFSVALIEGGVWGNTLPTAAAARVRHQADSLSELPALTALVDATLLADLPEAAAYLMSRVQAVAAVASDVGHLLVALPPLAQLLRYGNVRQTDADLVRTVLQGLVARICIGLPGACGSLNEDAAEEMFGRIQPVHAALALVEQTDWMESWRAVLRQLIDLPNLHGLIAGRACRLLLDSHQLDAEEAARRLGLALSTANAPAQAAAWVDGFLRDSGLLLVHDAALWQVLDEWVSRLTGDHFAAALPLLRRTFSTFAGAERRQLGNRVASGGRAVTAAPVRGAFDPDRANLALPLLAQLLGLKEKETT